MTNHATQFESTSAGLVLQKAILLYGASTSGPARVPTGAFASIHPVDHIDGKPVIGTGAPLQRAHVRQWTQALGRNLSPEILPDNVLVSHPDMLVWWVPEQVRTAYFALSDPPKGLRALSVRTTVAAPYPAHVFVVSRNGGGLAVFALAESRRPTSETRLLYSPILNVYVSGDLCWGNIPQPKAISISAIPEYEAAVFDSWSTHPNLGQQMTVTGKGGLVKLWDDLVARKAKRFPVERLKPFGQKNVTLGEIVAGAAR